jgi:hypothetical protein
VRRVGIGAGVRKGRGRVRGERWLGWSSCDVCAKGSLPNLPIDGATYPNSIPRIGWNFLRKNRVSAASFFNPLVVGGRWREGKREREKERRVGEVGFGEEERGGSAQRMMGRRRRLSVVFISPPFVFRAHLFFHFFSIADRSGGIKQQMRCFLIRVLGGSASPENRRRRSKAGPRSSFRGPSVEARTPGAAARGRAVIGPFRWGTAPRRVEIDARG